MSHFLQVGALVVLRPFAFRVCIVECSVPVASFLLFFASSSLLLLLLVPPSFFLLAFVAVGYVCFSLGFFPCISDFFVFLFVLCLFVVLYSLSFWYLAVFSQVALHRIVVFVCISFLISSLAASMLYFPPPLIAPSSAPFPFLFVCCVCCSVCCSSGSSGFSLRASSPLSR